MAETSDVVWSDPAAQVAELLPLLREGGWDGDDVVAGVSGLITYAEDLREKRDSAYRTGFKAALSLLTLTGADLLTDAIDEASEAAPDEPWIDV